MPLCYENSQLGINQNVRPEEFFNHEGIFNTRSLGASLQTARPKADSSTSNQILKWATIVPPLSVC